MENRTLLTVVALLLAGIVTIVLASSGSDDGEENVFHSDAIEMRQNARDLRQSPAQLSSTDTSITTNTNDQPR